VQTRLVIARTEPFAADGVGATRLGFQGQACDISGRRDRYSWASRNLAHGRKRSAAKAITLSNEDTQLKGMQVLPS
jgi:hypothetical protein